MFKQDDYIRSQPDSIFHNWQGFARSMLLRKPITETQDLTKTLHNYSSTISRDLSSKIPIGANGKEDFGKGKDRVDRFRSLREVGLAVINHDQGEKVVEDSKVESHRYQLRSIAQRDLVKKLGDSERMSATVLPSTSKETGNRAKDKMQSDFVASVHRLTRSRLQVVSDRHDDIVDGFDSASVCGVLLEDGSTCSVTPINGRKRCTEHKGQRLSRASPEKHTRSEVPLGREREEETETICGVILPDMVPCRTKPVSRRKRCEDHKGMRTNAFFFLFNPTERDKIVKEDKSKSKPETTSSTNKDDNDSGVSLLCEATTKNGLPCTRKAPTGIRRCWQHKDHQGSSRNVQSATVSKVTCGVKIHNGLVCEKAPVKGRKRCEEHKGLRIIS